MIPEEVNQEYAHDNLTYEGIGITRGMTPVSDNFVRQVFKNEGIPALIQEDFYGYLQIECSLSDNDKNTMQASKFSLKVISDRILFNYPRGRLNYRIIGSVENMVNLYAAKMGNAYQGAAWKRINTRIANITTERPQKPQNKGLFGGLFKRGF